MCVCVCVCVCVGCVDPGHINTTLCALSSVARLSVSMTMLMSSGIYRTPSERDRSRAICLRRPASVIAAPRSGGGGGARAPKRRTVSGGEAAASRGPSRIESMPNMRGGVAVSRRARAAAQTTAAGELKFTIPKTKKA